MKPLNILILCTHNSARSILGEAMLNHLAQLRDRPVKAFSAGSAPSGTINPFALSVLNEAGIQTHGYNSKSWHHFVGEDAPLMHAVITVCDSAAQEVCPYWPGNPVRVHWGYPDPSRSLGSDIDKARAFELTRQAIGYRMLQLLLLPFETMSAEQLKTALEKISSS
jgi:arsenate reductase (thioredoxin)